MMQTHSFQHALIARLYRCLAIIVFFSFTSCYKPLAYSRQPRAFQQQHEADLVIDFWYWDSIWLVKPRFKQDTSKRITREELVDLIEKKQIARSMAVVIRDKRWAPKGKEISNAELASQFHRMGFRRVVVQQAVSALDCPDGLPILIDSQM